MSSWRLDFLPFTYTAIIICSISLIALPFLTGFFKEIVLELYYSQYTVSTAVIDWFGTISAFLTPFYYFRLITKTFLTDINGFI